jgi:hypothetical protein
MPSTIVMNNEKRRCLSGIAYNAGARPERKGKENPNAQSFPYSLPPAVNGCLLQQG